ncbi:hypothetical protein D3C71_1375820 [compost metagenome]
MGGAAACMHDALGNAFVIEVGDLLAQDEVFQQGRPARRGPQRILVVTDRDALVGRQDRMAIARALVQFIPFATGVGRGCGGVLRAFLAGGHEATPGAGGKGIASHWRPGR